MKHCRISKEELFDIAVKHGWSHLESQDNIYMCSYSKRYNGGTARINVYRSKMTVTTQLNHPKRGKNQLFRKNISMDMLEKIFKNPRIHTNKGYRKR